MMQKKSYFLISHLEYTHKNEIIDMCSDKKYLIVQHSVVYIIVMIIVLCYLRSLSIVCKN
jgi:hypothetical protein